MSSEATIEEAIREIGLLEEEEVELLATAFALALADDPGADLDVAEGVILDMVSELEPVAGLESPAAQAEALAGVIAGRFHFEGDRVNYDSPGNADLLQVVETRRGLPVALSIIYAEVARQLGWDAQVLNVPGHVLVRLGSGDGAVLVDPFDSGRTVSDASLHDLLVAHYRRAIPRSQRDFPPMSNREVLVRLLNNPASRAETARDYDRARELYRRMVAIAPADLTGWWGAARMAFAMGEPDEIRACLGAMLEVTRDPHMRQRIRQILTRNNGTLG